MEMKIGVIDMEDDMVLKFPYEDFTDVTMAIGDNYGDGVRGNDGGACLTWILARWRNLVAKFLLILLIQVVPPGGKISN